MAGGVVVGHRDDVTAVIPTFGSDVGPLVDALRGSVAESSSWTTRPPRRSRPRPPAASCAEP